MENYQIKDIEPIFNKLVEYAHKKNKLKQINLENKDSYIKFIYKKISQYLLSIDPYKVLLYMDSYVNIIYNSEIYGEKIYRIFCPWYGKNEIYIPENPNDINCPMLYFNDIMNYYKELNKKEKLINIEKGINELKNQGLTPIEIETEIKNILYKEKEVNKQKIKRI